MILRNYTDSTIRTTDGNHNFDDNIRIGGTLGLISCNTVT